MAKAIMVQGTASNAGKSIVTAALCRIFKQDGYKVAPFKAQNMALNSFITNEGLEMGRAQVMQAEASGIEPSVLMNPILLKPTDEMRSQVIVNGEIMDNLNAKDYYKNKERLVPAVKEAYNTLDKEYDIIVIEGAGSPAEINLKNNDIVNMYMAKLAKAPVILVGDIDRGGVFASLVGTLALLDEEEQDLVKCVLINKFRGDETILQPGIDMLTSIIHKPVLGIIPLLDVDIDDEDSLTSRFENNNSVGLIDIAVIRLPRISNFTDFNILESMPGVKLHYVDSIRNWKGYDMVLLPGTKNTMSDLLWMRENGLEALVLKHAAMQKPVFGICGGFQMLGETLKDPLGVEHGGEVSGLGLLPMTTVFKEEKIRTRVKGKFNKVSGIFSELSDLDFEGYEIHMGTPTHENGYDLAQITQNGSDMSNDGLCNDNVYGSYVHGIFDRGDVAKTIVAALLREKGLSDEDVKATDVDEYKNQQYDLLAEGFRKHLDMKKLYEILEEGVNR